jgi:hypothetical protein
MGNVNRKFACEQVARDPIGVYDRLPKTLRKILQDAEYDLLPSSVKKLNKQVGVKKAAKIIREKLDETVRKSVLLTYGPDHPQAERESQ